MIDTNILIYFFDGLLSEHQKKTILNIFENSFIISIISKIEFLGFRNFIDEQKFILAKEFVNIAKTYSLNDELVEKVIEIKQKYNLKLGDSIIGATAILNDLIVVTRNEKDFKKIPDLSVLNPFS